MKNKKQPNPLPSWIVVSAKDPKLKEAVEKHLAEKLESLKPSTPKDES